MNVLSMPTEVTGELLIVCLFLGAASLAAWFLVRFERLGPRSLTSAMAGWLMSGLLIVSLPALIDGVFAWGLPEPRLLVIFGLVLPVFTYFFLAGAWFMRTLLKVASGVR